MKIITILLVSLFNISAFACPEITGLFNCENSEDSFDFAYRKDSNVYTYKVSGDTFVTDNKVYSKDFGGILLSDYLSYCESGKLITKKDNENVFEPGIIHTLNANFYYADDGVNITAELSVYTNDVLRGEVVRKCIKQ